MKTQVEDLVKEIQYLNAVYRAGDPQVTDQEYDALLVKLADLDPDNPLLKKGVIESAPTTRKRKLPVPMMSLNKEKSVDDIKHWLNKAGITDNDIVVITPKYNGISLLVDYTKETATTRGDGEVGQRCDEHFKLMNGKFFKAGLGIYSGEAIISRKNWDEHFKGKLSPTGSPYKLNNATVSGLLNSDDPTEELQYVDFIKYNIHGTTLPKAHMLDYINDINGLKTKYILVYGERFTEELLDEFYHSNNIDYPIDGLVFDINNPQLRNKLGFESNGNPAYSRALKLDKWVEEFETVITGYDFTISKQGKLKGVVTFDPIDINGTEVKQATFYNAKFLYDFNLCPGVTITVKKSGEIIPKIVAVEGVRMPVRTEYKGKNGEGEYNIDYDIATDQIEHILDEKHIYFQSIEVCPACGSILKWDENGVEIICESNLCRGIWVSKIEHFFTAIGVEEFGRPTIEALFTAGYYTVEMIFNIHRKELSSLEGFGESSADIILNQFNKVKEAGVPLARLMYAWDLFEGKIGEKTAQLILDNITDLNNIKVDQLIKIKGVNTITADCFIQALEAFKHMPDLLTVSYITQPKKVAQTSLKQGFNVCFSGIRDAELEQHITDNGGQVVSGVSKTTTHLIVKDPDQSTSKTVKARELGVKIMTIEQFKNL